MKAVRNIGVKQFQKNFTKIATQAQRGVSFDVFRHSTPLFRIAPPHRQEQKPRYHLRDVLAASFASDDPKLSARIDTILYGA